MKKHFSKILINFIIALFLEVIVFNITSYRAFLGNYEKREFTSFENVEYDNSIVLLKLDNLNMDLATVKIELRNCYNPVEYRIYFSDETSSNYMGLDSKQYIEKSEKSKYIPVYLSGKVNGVIISIDKNIYEDEKIEKITLNEKIPFKFNIIRFIIVFLILLVIYFLKNDEVFKEKYSISSLKQELILLGTICVFCIVISFINQTSIEPDEHRIYNEKFVNSVYNGHFYLDFEPGEDFLNLENPYDAIERSSVERGVDYLWDTAYYNGKFYIYFGILPLLVIFLPYYATTKCYLDMSLAVLALSILILVLIKEILSKIVNRYFKDLPFKFVLFSLIILCSGSMIIYANGMSRFYEMSILSGLYCVLQGMFFILKSIETEENKYKNIFWGSLFLSLSVACRPTDLLASLIIVPYLLKLLIDNIKILKNEKIPLLKLILAVGIPYISVGVFLMWYNYVRFESPFEFGAKYQLTIVNMMALKSRIFAIPTGIIANLFSIPNFIPDFPFITNHNKLMEFYGYYYIENMIGGLFILAPICFMNFYVLKINKKTQNKELKVLINSLIIVGSLIAILSIMMAGSNQRYLIDYSWMFILSGILIFSIFFENLKSIEAKNILKKIFGTITIITLILGVLSGIVSEKEHMKKYSSEFYYRLKYSICFWE